MEVFIIDSVGASGIRAAALKHVVQFVRPGVRSLEREAITEGVPKVELERVIVRIARHLFMASDVVRDRFRGRGRVRVEAGSIVQGIAAIPSQSVTAT